MGSSEEGAGPHSMADWESHDIIWEVSCYTETLDLLYEARMIAGVKEGQVTEMHDISWESIDSTVQTGVFHVKHQTCPLLRTTVK